MDKVGAYSTYQNNLMESLVKNKKEADKSSGVGKTEKNGKALKNEAVKKTAAETELKLSDKAKELLQQLKEKYSNMDFMVANYASDEEAQSYLSRGAKEYSVLIEPETLEAMANDEETKAKYMSLIEESTSKLSDVREQLEEEAQANGTEVKSIGVSIGNDGSVSYFAELEKASVKQKERIEASREKKTEEKKAEAKKAEKEKQQERLKTGYGDNLPQTERKSMTVKADSIEELLEKIRTVDWSEVKPVRPETGSRFNCTI